MTRTRPLAVLASATIAVLVVGSVTSLFATGIANPWIVVVGVAAAGVVGLVCLVGAREAGITRTPYWSTTR